MPEYLKKKFSINRIEDMLYRSPKGTASYNDIWKSLGVTRSRLYFRLNNIKRFVLKKNLDLHLVRTNTTGNPGKEKSHVERLLKTKNGERNILLNPGPVLTTATVKSALIQHDICHRDKNFEELIKSLRKRSRKIFKADGTYSFAFISGSGTSGLEAAISSSISPDKKLLVLSNGAFGTRLCEIAQVHRIETILVEKPWASLFDIEEIEEKLKLEKEISAIAMNHHETSVGLLNPVHEVGRLAAKYNKMLIVDAVSSLGAEKLNVIADNIDICVTSANKCLHSFSGVAIVCVSNKAKTQMEDISPRSYYLDLKKYLKYAEVLNQTPYTPAVSNFYALDQALKELLDEGLESRRLRYIELNSILKSELSRLGFEFLTDNNCASHSILTVKIPEGIDFEKLYYSLKEQGFLIYRCKSLLKDKYFQIANMGALRQDMLYDFIFSLEKILDQLRKNDYKN
jgi:2-aminoethylphosphonate-pyruvate transaminase